MNFFSIIQLNNLTQIIRFRNKVQFPGNQFQTISKIAFYKIAVSTEENIFVDKVRHLEKKKMSQLFLTNCPCMQKKETYIQNIHCTCM